MVGSTVGEHTHKDLNLEVASNIFLAWLVTFPATAAVAALIYLLLGIF